MFNNKTHLGYLHSGKLQPNEMVEQVWRATIPSGLTKDDVMRPEFWKHFTKKIKVSDRIHALWEDNSQELDLRVLDIIPGEIRVAVLNHYNYDDVDPSYLETESHTVKWRGAAKWCVVNKATNEVVKEKLNSKGEAARYMKSHMVAAA
jgi:hypothetical protein